MKKKKLKNSEIIYLDVNISSRGHGSCPFQSLSSKIIPENICEIWAREKIKNPGKIRLGTLGEPTEHPEFIEFLKLLKKDVEYFTNGVILGSPLDPRHDDILEATKKYCSRVYINGESKFYERAKNTLEKAGIDTWTTYPIEDIDKIPEGSKIILFPSPSIKTEELKDKIKTREDIKIMNLPENLIFVDNKLIRTKNYLNLKPI